MVEPATQNQIIILKNIIILLTKLHMSAGDLLMRSNLNYWFKLQTLEKMKNLVTMRLNIH